MGRLRSEHSCTSNTYLLSIFYMLSPVLGTLDKPTGKQTKVPDLVGAIF